MPVPPILSQSLSLPVLAAPLFIVSGPSLVAAQCQAGVIGSFPALNARPAELLNDWLAQITEENASFAAANPSRPVAPFAVNQIVHHSNVRLEQDMEVIVDHQVPIVITSLGARPEIYEAVHSYGGIVLHDVINNEFAHKAIEKGADGLIAVAAGAGGHAGTQSPFALLREIRDWFDGPLVLSGALAHGSSILAAQAAGADLAYVGSAFLPTHEANAIETHKNMVLESSASDIVYSNLFTGVHGNYLRRSVEAAGLDPDDLPQSDASKMNFSQGAVKAKAWKDIWGAGQGIGAVKTSMSTEELVAQLRNQYQDARDDLDTVLRSGTTAPTPQMQV